MFFLLTKVPCMSSTYEIRHFYHVFTQIFHQSKHAEIALLSYKLVLIVELYTLQVYHGTLLLGALDIINQIISK